MMSKTTFSDYAENSFEKSDTKPHNHLPTFFSTHYSRDTSYLDIACDKLRRASEGLAIPLEKRGLMIALLRQLCTPWGNAPAGYPRYYSNVSLEGMPFELSYAWGTGRGHELRMSFETLSDPPNPHDGLEACRRFTRQLLDIPELLPNISIKSYLQVEDLVVGLSPVGMAPMAHGVAWLSDQVEPVMKIYLNPNIDGFEYGLDRTHEAMDRLGAGQAWQAVCTHLTTIGAPAPVPVVLALDLGDPATSRIKIYLPHTGIDAAAIDQQAEIAQTHVKGKFEQALRQVIGQTTPDWKKVPVTCLTLIPGKDLPYSATLYVPLHPHVENDAVAQERVSAFARDEGVDPSSYESLIAAITDRPLSESTTHNFLSYRPGKHPRFAVYLAPGVYKAGQ